MPWTGSAFVSAPGRLRRMCLSVPAQVEGRTPLRATGSLQYVVGCPCNSCARTRAANSEQQAARGTHRWLLAEGESRPPILSCTPWVRDSFCGGARRRFPPLRRGGRRERSERGGSWEPFLIYLSGNWPENGLQLPRHSLRSCPPPLRRGGNHSRRFGHTPRGIGSRLTRLSQFCRTGICNVPSIATRPGRKHGSSMIRKTRPIRRYRQKITISPREATF